MPHVRVMVYLTRESNVACGFTTKFRDRDFRSSSCMAFLDLWITGARRVKGWVVFLRFTSAVRSGSDQAMYFDLHLFCPKKDCLLTLAIAYRNHLDKGVGSRANFSRNDFR